MRNIALAAAFLTALAIARPPTSAPAGVATGVHAAGTLTLSAAKRPSRPDRGAPGQTACTRFGCVPIPPGCRAVPDFDAWGPTGFDVIVCPHR